MDVAKGNTELLHIAYFNFSFGKECREEDLFRVFLRFPWLFYLLEVDTVKE